MTERFYNLVWTGRSADLSSLQSTSGRSESELHDLWREFFYSGYPALLPRLEELETRIDEDPGFAALAGYTHIFSGQFPDLLVLNSTAWQQGLRCFEKGLASHPGLPGHSGLVWDRLRALSVLDPYTDHFPVADQSWEYSFSFVLFRLFMILCPLLPDNRRDIEYLCQDGVLPESLYQLSAFLPIIANSQQQQTASLLLAADLNLFDRDFAAASSALSGVPQKDQRLEEIQVLLYVDQFSNSDEQDQDADSEAIAAEENARATALDLPLPELKNKKKLDSPAAYAARIRLALHLGETGKAAALLKKALEHFPANAVLHLLQVRLLLAVCLPEDRDYALRIASARTSLEMALKVLPCSFETAETGHALALVEKDRREIGKALALLFTLRPWDIEIFFMFAEYLIELSPSDPDIPYIGELERGLALLEKSWQHSNLPDYVFGLLLTLLSRWYDTLRRGKTGGSAAVADTDPVLARIKSLIDGASDATMHNPEFLAYSGLELFLNGLEDYGEDFISRALALDSRHSYALQSYGVVLETKGEREQNPEYLREAFHYFNQATECESDPFIKGRYLLYLVDFLPEAGMDHLAKELLEAGVEKELPVPEIYERLADTLLQLGQEQKAMELLHNACLRFPDNGDLAFFYGRELSREGELEKGLEFLQRAADIEPAEALYRNQIGIVHIEQGNRNAVPEQAREYYRKAVEVFSTALELMPDSALILINRGDARRLCGDYNAAAVDMSRALALAPEDAFHHYCMGRLCCEQAMHAKEQEQEQHLKEAETWFKKAQRLDPDNLAYTGDLGDMYYYFGYYIDAIDCYRRVLEADAAQPFLYDAIGMCYYHLHEPDEALNWFTQGLESGQESGEMFNAMGLCYFEKEDFESAQEMFKRAADSDPGNAAFLDNLALAQYRIMGFDDGDQHTPT